MACQFFQFQVLGAFYKWHQQNIISVQSLTCGEDYWRPGYMLASNIILILIPLSAAKVGSYLTYFQSKVVNLTYFQSKVIYFQSKVIYFQCKPRLEKFLGAGGQKGAVQLGRNTVRKYENLICLRARVIKRPPDIGIQFFQLISSTLS